jgi:hypothetical protein
MDPRLVNLLEMFFAAKEAGNVQQAAYYWATYIALIRALGPQAIVAAARTATVETVIAVSEATVSTIAARSAARLTTRTFIKRLVAAFGTAAKPMPPALIVGIVIIGTLSSAQAAYAEGKAISQEPEQYNLYLAKYVQFVSRALALHPNAKVEPPLTFAECHENTESICLPSIF